MIPEQEISKNKPELTSQERVESLLKRTPSGPDFTQSTIGYCNEAIEASLAKFGDTLINRFPAYRDFVTAKIDDITKNQYRELPKNNFVLEGKEKYLQYPNGNKYQLNKLGEAIFLANPDLGIFQYMLTLFRALKPQDAPQRFPWFNQRLSKIAETGKLSLDDPKIKYIATSYITQVGKVHANAKTHNLLEKARLFGGVDNPEKINAYLDKVGEMVTQIKLDEYFIAKGLSTMNNIAQEANLDAKQTQLLLDLAFIRNRAFDQEREFRQVLEPLIKLTAENRWDEAFFHRDFLLNHFSASFPPWRSREHAATGTTFQSFKDLARAVVNGGLIIEDKNVPDEYRKSFAEIFPRKLERARSENETKIVKESINLSKRIIRELALTTINKQYKRLNAVFVRSPYVLYTPNEQRITDIEIMDDKQICWYQTNSSLDVRLKDGKTEVVTKNRINFGRVLNNLIRAAYKYPSDAEVLNIQEIKNALESAYQKEKEHNPKIAKFTLVNYLKAITGTVNFGVKQTSKESLARFLQEFEEK